MIKPQLNTGLFDTKLQTLNSFPSTFIILDIILIHGRQSLCLESFLLLNMWFWFWKFWHHLGEGFLSLVSLRSHTHWLAICSSRHFLKPFHLISQFLCFNPYKKIDINSNWTFSMYKRSLVPFTVILGYMSGEGHCSFLLGFETKRIAVLKLKKKTTIGLSLHMPPE